MRELTFEEIFAIVDETERNVTKRILEENFYVETLEEITDLIIEETNRVIFMTWMKKKGII